MYPKKILWIGFALMAGLQLWVPASMIFQQQHVLNDGVAFKFKAAPVDPYDPFRGKYIVLRYEAVSFVPKPGEQWESGETLFVELAHDSAGFARILKVHKQMPPQNSNIIKASVDYVSQENVRRVFIEWPFDRFYMEESKAKAAELVYNRAAADSSLQTYSLVKIKDGAAVLQNVFINDIPITQFIKK
ncbi:MAG: hypothetical protein EOO03_07045 [Chitinophagaceae bacterium]|nr:MAG: hypothetical protein EOO03_07045 [Chitinophagaceae bacterium]